MRRTTLAALGLAASAAALNAALARAAATAPAFTDAALAAAVVELPVDRSVLDLTLTSESVDGSRSDAISPDRRVLTLASDVLFAFGSADLTADAATRLAATAAAAQGSGSTAAIDGYTDAVGDPAANLALSERRATAVLDALRPQLPGLAFTVREDSDCTRGWHRRRMLTVPLPGVDPGAALQQVRAAGLACQNARSGGGNAVDRYNQYLRWASETAASLGYVLRPSDVDQLVATPRHWALQGLGPGIARQRRQSHRLEARGAEPRADRRRRAARARGRQEGHSRGTAHRPGHQRVPPAWTALPQGRLDQARAGRRPWCRPRCAGR